MNDVTTLTSKLKFKIEFIEKPYFYSDGKIIRSTPFVKGEKVLLKEFSGNSLKEIITELNKQNLDKDIAVFCIGKDGSVTVEDKDNKVKVQCLLM